MAIRLGDLRHMGREAMRDYLYLRVRKSEPWVALHWTFGANAIVNLHDGSVSTIPEVMYTGIRNTELRGRLGSFPAAEIPSSASASTTGGWSFASGIFSDDPMGR